VESPRGRAWLRRAALALLLVLVLFALALWLLPSQRVTSLLLGRIGTSLGLEVSVGGASEYRLRGTPAVVLRDVIAREPGARTPLFRASRVFLSLPWSTLRARGAVLDATRLELDAPAIDLPALQHWLATRPPTKEKRLPGFRDGLRIRDGRLFGDGWRIDDIAIDARRFQPTARFEARVRGRYVAAPLSVPMDLAVSLARPDALLQQRATGLGVAGTLSVEHARDWRMPAYLTLSAPLRVADTVELAPARIGLAARYETGATRLPFALGLRGPLRIGEAIVLAPAMLVLHGHGAAETDPVPPLQAHAILAWQERLVLQLRGTIAQWPPAWPALPAPLDASRAPLPVALDYAGRVDFSDPATLSLSREATRFDARFRLPKVLAWVDAADHGAPLPPLDGRLVTPRLDIGGVRLDGVEMDVHDDDAGTVDGQ
jgi:hypothetical protein